MIYLSLICMAINERYVPSIIWYIGIPLLLVGGIMKYCTTRLVWIRFYQFTLFVLIVLPAYVSLWLASTMERTLLEKLSIGIITVGSMFLLAHRCYRHVINRPERTYMPHGAYGELNHKTGIVDPTRVPAPQQKIWEKNQSKMEQLWQYTPLIAGLSMFFTKMVNTDTKLIVMDVCVFLTLLGGVIGSGNYLAIIVSILRWEEKHHQPIYLKLVPTSAAGAFLLSTYRRLQRNSL